MTNDGALDALNREPEEQAAADLASCNASPRWVAEILARRPYADAASLLRTAEEIARRLPWDEVRTALDAHPRIGDRPSGQGTEARWSRQEQAAVGGSDGTTHDALRAGNEAYERRFGHVFLIRAADRSAEDVLGELRRRLGNDEVGERAEVTEQLAQITRLRVEKLLVDRSPSGRS